MVTDLFIPHDQLISLITFCIGSHLDGK